MVFKGTFKTLKLTRWICTLWTAYQRNQQQRQHSRLSSGGLRNFFWDCSWNDQKAGWKHRCFDGYVYRLLWYFVDLKWSHKVPICSRVIILVDLFNKNIPYEICCFTREISPLNIHDCSSVPEMLKMMTELEDQPVEEWVEDDDEDDADLETNASVGESTLDRLGCALGGNCVFPHVQQNVSAMLQNGE